MSPLRGSYVLFYFLFRYLATSLLRYFQKDLYRIMIREIDAVFAVIARSKCIIIKNVIDPEGRKVTSIGAVQETRSSLAEGIMKT
jgi:hypothetical protein